MGFLLHFARALQIKSRQSQVQLEMMQISNQQDSIANRMSMMDQMGSFVDKENPGIQMMQFTKQMLVSMSNALDLRLKHLQTRAQALSAEEQSLDKVLPDEIAKSAPKYCA